MGCICSVIADANKDRWISNSITRTKYELGREVAKEHPELPLQPKIKPVGEDRTSIAFELTDEELSVVKRIQEILGESLLESARYLRFHKIRS